MRRFAFSLARELGWPVGRLLKSMSAREFSEWMAFAQIENEETQQRTLANRAESGLQGIKAARAARQRR